MGDLLDREELETLLSGLTGDGARGRIRRHIAALEKERDEYARWHIDLLQRVHELEKESAIALADNAALVEHLRFWEKMLVDVVTNGAGADLGWMDQPKAEAMLAAIRAPHPGASLLEEHRKALEYERQRAELAELAHAVTADVARVAVVRAKNEGLEDAAVRVKDDDVAEMIRTLKEHE